MFKILIISNRVPYDSVAHAGGKTHNYYLKKLNIDNSIYLISIGTSADRFKSDLEAYGINNYVSYRREDFFHRSLRYLINLESRYSPFNRSVRLCVNSDIIHIHKSLRKIKGKGYVPDIVLFEWTEVAFLSRYVKKLFPDSSVVIDEMDVTFQRYDRLALYRKNFIGKKFANYEARRVKQKEIGLLNVADLVLVQNDKDKSLLVNNAIPLTKIHKIVPFFMNFEKVNYQPIGNDILFFGAMNRPENFLSAIWFIDNVMPRISDRRVRFVVAGGNPHPKLKSYANERVKVLGYVEDMSPIFSRALCFCAPLVLGAGIKVKVLEALSAGLPTLTNSIGIEGIPARNGVDYIHCETADDYAKSIEILMNQEIDLLSLSKNSKALIQNYFNIESSYLSLQRRFAQLIDNKPTSGSL